MKREPARFVRSLDSGLERPADVGARGAAISLMHSLGLNVPPSFAITTQAFRAWRAANGSMPAAVWREVSIALAGLTNLSDAAAEARELMILSSPPRRPPEPPGGSESSPAEAVSLSGAGFALDAADLSDGLRHAVERVWRSHLAADGSWSDTDAETALVVQQRIARTADDPHLHGRVVSRDPLTGSPQSLICIRPDAASSRSDWSLMSPGQLPDVSEALEDAVVLLESVWGDMCGIEFVIDRHELWLLDAFPPLRSGMAAIRVAVDMTDEALVDLPIAMRAIPVWALEQAGAPRFAPRQALEIVARAWAVAPGAGVGAAVIGIAEARERGDSEPVVLVAPADAADEAVRELTPSAILLAGPSRSVLPAGAFAKRPAVCHVPDLAVDAERHEIRTASGRVFHAGDEVSVDGRLGLLAAGRAKLVDPQPEPELGRVLRWAEDLSDGLPIADSEPPGWRRVASVADLLTNHRGGPLLDVSDAADPAERDARLRELVQAAVDAGASRIGLALPDPLNGWDPYPPVAPWRLIVAPPRLGWAARLLAARVQTDGGEPSLSPPPQIDRRQVQASAQRLRRSRLLP